MISTIVVIHAFLEICYVIHLQSNELLEQSKMTVGMAIIYYRMVIVLTKENGLRSGAHRSLHHPPRVALPANQILPAIVSS